MDPYSSDIQYHENQLPQNNQQLQFVNCTTQHYPQQFQNIPTVEGSSDPLQQQQLKSISDSHCQESDQTVDFKSHSLPLARIKKIMKSDEHVRMISAEAPVLLAKACEMFIQDVTLRSWNCTEESKRRTMQKGDISAALSTSDLFDFLVDIVPREKRIASTMQPVMPFLLTSLNNNVPQQQHNYSLGEDAGLTMGLPFQLVENDNVDQGYNANCIQEGCPGFSKHSTWPPDH